MQLARYTGNKMQSEKELPTQVFYRPVEAPFMQRFFVLRRGLFSSDGKFPSDLREKRHWVSAASCRSCLLPVGNTPLESTSRSF